MAKNSEAAMVIIRIVVGIIFFAHGLQKVQGIEGIVGFFGKIGLPGFMAYTVAGIEFLGGLLLILGLGTRILAGLLSLIMVGAIFKVKLAAGFLGGYELDFALLGMTLGLILAEKTSWSLDALFLSRKQSPALADGTN